MAGNSSTVSDSSPVKHVLSNLEGHVRSSVKGDARSTNLKNNLISLCLASLTKIIPNSFFNSGFLRLVIRAVLTSDFKVAILANHFIVVDDEGHAPSDAF